MERFHDNSSAVDDIAFAEEARLSQRKRLERASQCFGLTTPATSIADLAAQVAALDEDAQKHEDAVLPGTPSLEEARRYLASLPR